MNRIVAERLRDPFCTPRHPIRRTTAIGGFSSEAGQFFDGAGSFWAGVFGDDGAQTGRDQHRGLWTFGIAGNGAEEAMF
ncbi:hypothetical protein [Mesorhizobium sp. RMAD-H1]|uniref:hypothetical protein n=1 Tax=Mesorhizobium sp. RMAD-H1 TaxID=2587065 RepID=UPI0016158F94|nr:hypothetical protein [Mesorhizobium sp. RMAD-H1]MBB2971472.1 hypothetical protein [Mesorhizobium sp. RMAD-H1]